MWDRNRIPVWVFLWLVLMMVLMGPGCKDASNLEDTQFYCDEDNPCAQSAGYECRYPDTGTDQRADQGVCSRDPSPPDSTGSDVATDTGSDVVGDDSTCGECTPGDSTSLNEACKGEEFGNDGTVDVANKEYECVTKSGTLTCKDDCKWAESAIWLDCEPDVVLDDDGAEKEGCLPGSLVQVEVECQGQLGCQLNRCTAYCVWSNVGDCSVGSCTD